MNFGFPYSFLSRFPPLYSGTMISTPAFSSPAFWCREFHSRIFHSCIFDALAFSTPAFSVAPGRSLISTIALLKSEWDHRSIFCSISELAQDRDKGNIVTIEGYQELIRALSNGAIFPNHPIHIYIHIFCDAIHIFATRLPVKLGTSNLVCRLTIASYNHESQTTSERGVVRFTLLPI